MDPALTHDGDYRIVVTDVKGLGHGRCVKRAGADAITRSDVGRFATRARRSRRRIISGPQGRHGRLPAYRDALTTVVDNSEQFILKQSLEPHIYICTALSELNSCDSSGVGRSSQDQVPRQAT